MNSGSCNSRNPYVTPCQEQELERYFRQPRKGREEAWLERDIGRRAGPDPRQRSWELGLYSMGPGEGEECAYFQKAKDVAKGHSTLAMGSEEMSSLV